MKVVAAISGLMVMVVTAHSLGLFLAIVAGAVAGGLAGVLLSVMTGTGSASSSDPKQTDLPEAPSQGAVLAETRKRLDKAKKIRVPQDKGADYLAKEADYLAKIIIGIEKGEADPHWQLGAAYLHGRLVIWDQFPKDKQTALFWCRRSAELGSASSQYHLGVM